MSEPVCSKCGVAIDLGEIKGSNHNRKGLELFCQNCWDKTGLVDENEYWRLYMLGMLIAIFVVAMVLTNFL